MAGSAAAGGERRLTLVEDDYQPPEEIPDSRPAGPDPPTWSVDDTRLWLVGAFRQMPYTPIYAPRGNTLRSADPNKPSSTFDILAFSATVLGEGSDLHKVVLRWARALATGGDVGGSIRGYCAAADISERTFHNRRARAVALITEAKVAADSAASRR